MFNIGDIVQGNKSKSLYKVLGLHLMSNVASVEVVQRGEKSVSEIGYITRIPLRNLSMYSPKRKSHPLTTIFKDFKDEDNKNEEKKPQHPKWSYPTPYIP